MWLKVRQAFQSMAQYKYIAWLFMRGVCVCACVSPLSEEETNLFLKWICLNNMVSKMNSWWNVLTHIPSMVSSSDECPHPSTLFFLLLRVNSWKWTSWVFVRADVSIHVRSMSTHLSLHQVTVCQYSYSALLSASMGKWVEESLVWVKSRILGSLTVRTLSIFV